MPGNPFKADGYAATQLQVTSLFHPSTNHGEQAMMAPTISINVRGLWENWQRSQRDENIRQHHVAAYQQLIRSGSMPPPITFENIVFEGEAARIRTADGRHRITSAYNERLETIEAVNTELARQIKDMFGL